MDHFDILARNNAVALQSKMLRHYPFFSNSTISCIDAYPMSPSLLLLIILLLLAIIVPLSIIHVSSYPIKEHAQVNDK